MVQTITPTIVTVNTTVTKASQPSQLQQSGAVVSTGGSTLAAGTDQYCGQLSDVTAILQPSLALESLAWASGTVTATTSASLGLTTGETFTVIISGAVPAGYNGTYRATVTGTDTFTYALAASPGTETAPGQYSPPSAGFLVDAATTFFAQGTQVGLFVLELGPQASNTAAITALGTWITANLTPQQFYAYLVPGSWDVDESVPLNALAANYGSPTGQTYFFVTTTTTNIAAYAGNKAVIATVPNPTAPVAEHQAAALFYQWLVNNPGSANPLAPMSYRFAFGVTPWAFKSNIPTLTTILSDFGNAIIPASEGGISNAMMSRGTTMDGAQAAFWYGVDWFRINVKQALAAGIINGSNQNPPLLYDQNGINSLQAIAEQIGNSAVAFGCASAVTVTAVPFTTYTTQNPNDYAAGIYNGLSATLNGQSAFLSVTFNLDATQFAS
ncbi:hypothetical protein [Dyella sp.]|uniref:hypothetical protein n=1 Tax=Dyella sp. TaxID=1869338 RepID=UPI00283D9A3F|nr:hypothetical protein [Dyella sp.]MDR3445979.1 hypothetical protein [Dyella sp.]